MIRMFEVLLNSFHHHVWEFIDGNQHKRYCAECDTEEWLFSRPYPAINEAKYFWKEVK